MSTRAIRKAMAVTVCAAAIVVGGASAASAGEVTGNGRPIAVNGKSACAFSGLNDEVGPVPGPETGRTQNFGQIVRYVGPLGGVPGAACNPTKGTAG